MGIKVGEEEWYKLSELQGDEAELGWADAQKEMDGFELPIPRGFKILVLPQKVEEVSKGGIVLAAETTKALEITTNAGWVIAKGPKAYTNKEIFGDPPEVRCEVGDCILHHPTNGLDILLKRWDGKQLRIKVMNDDCVLCGPCNPASLVVSGY